MVYYAIIGDIIGSKELEDRAEVQKALNRTLNQVSTEYKRDIASRFSITLGDEFQGLLKTAQNLMEIIDIIRYQVYPVQLRFGIGIGEMSTEVVYKNSLGSDGPAYWAAREAIRYIHDKNDYGASRICVRRYEEKKEEDTEKGPDEVEKLNKQMRELTMETLNLSLRLCDLQELGWTESQTEFIRTLILKYRYQVSEYSQRKIARELGLSAQLLNNKMKTTNVMTYIEARQNIQKTLQMQGR